MILIACIDDRLGMAFGGRRQSRDKKVCEDIAKHIGTKKIGMQEKTKELFEGLELNVCGIDEKDAEYLFLEFASPSSFEDNTDGIILYRWNRHYPADIYFDIDLKDFRLISSIEFEGNSHDKITKEIYIREK